MMLAFTDIIRSNIGLSLAVAIVAIGLLVIGLGDVARFSLTRAWAISSVCFQQSIRRRVLWITPLVIVGVVIVSQLQQAVDPQDAIRQTTMLCLFATGMLVVLLTIILACTNLPREIETRVIYTVATKPTTRLEIVLGKVIGFVRVSFWVLLIMGVFTWGYLSFRDWRARSYISEQLNTPGLVQQVNRPTLEYYRDHGTLHARELSLPRSLNILAHLPTSAADRYIPGAGDGEIIATFTVDRSFIPEPEMTDPGETMGPTAAAPKGGVIFNFDIRVERSDEPPSNATPTTMPTTAATTLPATSPAAAGPATAPAPAAAAGAGRQLEPPKISPYLYDLRQESVAGPEDFGSPEGWVVPEGVSNVSIYVSSEVLARALPRDARLGRVFFHVTGLTEGYNYAMNEAAVSLIVPETGHRFPVDGELTFTGRTGQHGRQLRGGRESRRVAMFRFEGVPDSGRDRYQFELRLGVERLEEEEATQVALDFYGLDGRRVAGSELFVETNRPTYFDVPAEVVEGEGYWVVMRTQSNAWLGLLGGERASLKLVKDDQSFAWNLLKSLAVLWLMSLLVTIVSIFTSTFLSWPIAVVLTLVILSGRWAAELVGSADTSVGRTVVTDLMGRDAGAASARAVSESVDALVRMLDTVSQVLPDLSKFRAIEDLERGVAISPAAVLLPSLQVALGFGIPLVVLSYVFLKYKEVAP